MSPSLGARQPLLGAASRWSTSWTEFNMSASALINLICTQRNFTVYQYKNDFIWKQMALRKLAELEATARERWSLVDCGIVHRLGNVPLGAKL